MAVGYRAGVRRAFIRDQRIANGPETGDSSPARWAPHGDEAAQAEPVPPRHRLPECHALAIDTAKPLRITWPLDIGPEPRPPEGVTPRRCLRARQGVNELQNPGEGKAFYPFRIPVGGTYQTWFRVRWIDDGIGHIMCNNSWFAGFDDRPAEVIGNETDERHWFWQAGPKVPFTPGIHWLRIELREDGTLMDRVVIAPEEVTLTPAELDAAPPETPRELAGLRIPVLPARPVQDIEAYALPTESLVIGAPHTNAVTLCASWQVQPPATPFRGRIQVHCPTAPGLSVSGGAEIKCTPETSFVRRNLILDFPSNTTRRIHRTTISLADQEGTIVFRNEIRFFKPPAWAFLGPFKDQSRTSKKVYRYTGTIERIETPCDANPRTLALRQTPATLKLDTHPTTDGKMPAWHVVSDGSCYDWSGAVDLRCIYGDERPAFAYAVTWIHAETKLNHRSFSFQADDSGWLWINGHTAAHLPMDLPREAHRLWTSGPLSKGRNPVVVKLTQNQRYWGFRFDVVDWHWQGRRGDVVTGIEPDDWPTE